MKRTSLMMLGAAALLLASQLAMSVSAEANACRPGYKPVKYQNSGNTVCVLDVVAGNGKLKLKAK